MEVARKPQVFGLLLCKRLEVDPVEGHINLIGLFSVWRFAALPILAPPFTVYASAYGEGEGTLKTIVTRAETEEQIYTNSRWFAFPQGQILHLEIPIRRCYFPAPGRYLIELRFDDEIIANRWATVIHEGERTDS